MIKKASHNCVSEYQDQKYGPGKRVWNERKKDDKPIGWTCTVCGEKVKDA